MCMQVHDSGKRQCKQNQHYTQAMSPSCNHTKLPDPSAGGLAHETRPYVWLNFALGWLGLCSYDTVIVTYVCVSLLMCLVVYTV